MYMSVHTTLYKYASLYMFLSACYTYAYCDNKLASFSMKRRFTIYSIFFYIKNWYFNIKKIFLDIKNYFVIVSRNRILDIKKSVLFFQIKIVILLSNIIFNGFLDIWKWGWFLYQKIRLIFLYQEFNFFISKNLFFISWIPFFISRIRFFVGWIAKQFRLMDWWCPSVCLSVCSSVCLSTFWLTSAFKFVLGRILTPCMGIDLGEISWTATFHCDPDLHFFCSRSLNNFG